MVGQVDEVKARVDIVELVSSVVALTRSGSSLRAKCPFHEERTPSFHVFADRQSWRCFGACGEGGDAIAFVMKFEGVGFMEALRRLGAGVGVEITGFGDRNDLRARDAVRVNEVASDYYRERLWSGVGEKAWAYLASRGVSREVSEAFGLGYAPPEGGLIGRLEVAGVGVDEALAAGVLARGNHGRVYEMFRGRLVFPVRDWSARLVGFGARELDGNGRVKYLNTGKTVVFDKSRLLYGIERARELGQRDGLVLVEGYMDVLAAHQYGYENVVGVMGTAVTEGQARLARRVSGKVMLAMDGDPAGREAALRGLERSWEAFWSGGGGDGGDSVLGRRNGIELKVGRLPSGYDPDELIREDLGGWRELVDGAAGVFDFLVEYLFGGLDPGDLEGRAWGVRVMLRFISRLPDAVRRKVYLDWLAGVVGIEAAELARAMAEPAEDRAAVPGAVAAVAAEQNGINVDRDRGGCAGEDLVIALMLQYGVMLGDEALEGISEDWFEEAGCRALFTVLRGQGMDVSGVREYPEYLAALGGYLESFPTLAVGRMGALGAAWRQSLLRLERAYWQREVRRISAGAALAPGGTESGVLQLAGTRLSELDRELAVGAAWRS